MNLNIYNELINPLNPYQIDKICITVEFSTISYSIDWNIFFINCQEFEKFKINLFKQNNYISGTNWDSGFYYSIVNNDQVICSDTDTDTDTDCVSKYNFVNFLEKLVYPPDVRSIDFLINCRYGKTIYPVINLHNLPRQLKKLTIKSSPRIFFIINNLPNTLEFLDLSESHEQINLDFLPEKLKTIKLDSKYDKKQKHKLLNLPIGLEKIVIENTFYYSLDQLFKFEFELNK